MTRISLKSTTAILAAISLLLPAPTLAQSNSNANTQAADAEMKAETQKDAEAEAEALTEEKADVEDVTAEDANDLSDTDPATEEPVATETEAAPATSIDPEAVTEAEEAVDAEAAEDAKGLSDTDPATEGPVAAETKVAPANSTDPEAETEAEEAVEAEATEQQTGTATPDVSVIDPLPAAPLEPLAAEAEAETPTDVTTETITKQTSRSSDEEFKEWSPEDQNTAVTQQSVAPESKSKSGMSDLQKAGLIALGAAVVGAVLLNGQKVESNTGDRVIVVDEDNGYQILKDDDALLRQPGSDVRTQRFSDGSTRTNVMRGDGTEIVTIRDSAGRVLRRVLIETDGREYVLFDDTQNFAPVVVRDLPEPSVDMFDYQAASDRESLRAALLAADRRDIGRSFSLQQVRDINEVRQLSPEINLQNITFATASSAIQPSQAQQLRQMGLLMRDVIAENPTELFLIEGYTDAIGGPGYNLLLSDRRAESVALAFNEYFDVPTENMVVQGYGERFLKIPTQQAERVNRRVAVRRITTLVRSSGQ